MSETKTIEFDFMLDREEFDVLWKQAIEWHATEPEGSAKYRLGAHLREALDAQSDHWKDWER